MTLFSASNSSRIFCRHSVPFPMYRMRDTAWIFTLSQVSFSLTSRTHFSTILTTMMIMSRYRIAISAVAFWCVIAVIAPFAFLLAFMILRWAGPCWWKSALLIANAICWSILLGNGTLSSLLKIRRLSAMLEPVVGAGAGWASYIWFCGGTVSHRLVGVSTDVVAPFRVDVALGIGASIGAGVGAGAGAGAGFGFGIGFVFNFGIAIDLSCRPGGSYWLFSGIFSPPFCIRSASIEAFRATCSVSAFLSSLWSRSVPTTTPATMSAMPLPHSTSSRSYTSHFLPFSSNHAFIPCHWASCSAVCVCSMVTMFAMVLCSSASSWASC